jgi:hypothetical protein
MNNEMKFIELRGAQLMHLLGPDEVKPDELRKAGLTDKCLVRVNLQGDIEVRRSNGWDVIGGLLGDYEHRIKRETGLDWA